MGRKFAHVSNSTFGWHKKSMNISILALYTYLQKSFNNTSSPKSNSNQRRPSISQSSVLVMG